MNLNYKTLFEVKLMHEFFLTKEDGSSLFAEPDQLKRLAMLEQAYDLDRDAMSGDMDFEFPDTLKTQYTDIGLKIVPSYAGFKVVIRVNEIVLADHSVVFAPFFSLPDPCDILISFIKKTNLPDIYSNERIARSVPALYLFSNENLPDPRLFPFLVNPISSYDSGLTYEHGELAIDSSSQLQEYYYDSSGNLQPIAVGGSVLSFANENDRMLLPLRFYYSPTGKNPVTQLDLTLKDANSNPVKSFSFSQTDPFRKITLDFSDIGDQLELSATNSLPAALFSLEVTGNNGYTDTRKIVFSNSSYSISNWGAAFLKTRPTNALMNLIADDGWIIKRKDTLGNWTEAPVFEIPVKSRFGNFRYMNNNGKELTLNPALNNFLNKENQVLITRLPVPLCKYYFLVPEAGGAATKYLPNPRSYELKKDNLQRIYFDVPVSESDLFPIVP